MGSPIANVALTDTFDQWRIKTNQLIDAYGANLAYLTSNNTSVIQITPRFMAGDNVFIDVTLSSNIADISKVNAAAANAVSNVYSYSGRVHAFANHVYSTGNTNFEITNLAFQHANSGYATQNINYTLTNAAFAHANASYATGNILYALTNAAFAHANSGYATGNINYALTNASFAHANASYATQNINYTLTNSAFIHANTAYDQANNNLQNVTAAFGRTNSVYTHSNTILGTTNAAFLVANTGYISGNANYAVTNAAFDFANAAYATGNINYALTNAAFLIANVANQNTVAAYATVNAAFSVTNAVYAFANSMANNTNVGYNVTNAAFAHANAGYATQNINYTLTNAAFASINSNWIVTNSVFDVANTSANNANIYGMTYTNTSTLGANNFAGVLANNANAYAFSLAFNANQISTDLVTASNNWANTINSAAITRDTAGNNWSNTINTAIQTQFPAVNNYTVFVGASGNNWANNINSAAITRDTAGNNFTISVGVAGNNWANAVSVAGNNWANAVGTAGNNYTTSVGIAGNNWVNATFLPRSGGTITNDLVISGNLTISGLTTYANTQTLLIGDNIMSLNADLPVLAAPSENAGLEINRGSSANSYLIWNEATDKWTFNEGSIYYNIASNTSLETGLVGANNWSNTKVSTVSGTSGRITSSGGTTPSIDLSTAGAGAASYTTGISAITVDAYGRVTSVTGSANYVVTNAALGTPSSGTLTNCSGLPISTGVSGLGTGIASALAIAANTVNGVVTNGGALGTPSSGTLTNCTFPTLNQNTTGSAGSVVNALTIDDTGVGDGTGTTYNGSAAKKISYNSIGAVPSVRTLTFSAGTGISLSAGAQDLSANRTWTISTIQNIATTASPTFVGLTLSGVISQTFNGASVFGIMQDYYQNVVGNSDGPKIGWRKLQSDATTTTYAAGILNGVNEKKFAITTGTSSGFGTTLLTLDQSGNLNTAGSITQNGSQVITAGTIGSQSVNYANYAGYISGGSTFCYTNAGLGVGTSYNQGAGYINASQNITAYYSDERLKTDIKPIENALHKVKQISGVTFRSNDLAASFGYTDKKEQVGVIAQEIKKVLPHIIRPAPFDMINDENGNGISKSGENYMTVQYEKIIPLLIEAIKELSAQVEELKGNK